MRHRWRLVLLIVAFFGDAALAQDVLPSTGGTFQNLSEFSRRHMTPFGKPCLTLEGYAQAVEATASFFGSLHSQYEKAAPSVFPTSKIYEHGVKAINSCGQDIKVKVCYYKTDDCIMLNVPPWGKNENVLGIYPGLEAFRFESKEQFP